MENNEFQKVCNKNRACYYFDDINKFGNFDFDNILTDKKSHKNILIYNILCRTIIVPKPLRIRFNKIDGFIKSL